jgi:hypothetical protein
MIQFPEVMTHNYDPDRGAFRNICELPNAEAESILNDIRAAGKRRIRANYLQRRLAVEDWLMSESKKRLGSTSLERPIYFFLGDYADGHDRSRPQSFIIPLAEFSADMLTFTYPDSMASLPIATRDDHLPHRKEYHGRVFTLPEINDVVAKFGMPGDRWKTDPSMRYDRFIEVQVWNDGPIKRFLNRQ